MQEKIVSIVFCLLIFCYNLSGAQNSIVEPIHHIEELYSFLQQPSQNDIIEIKYDYDLGGQVFEISPSCTLLFNGGSLHNGIIRGDGFSINAGHYQILYDVFVDGKPKTNVFYADWFGIKGDGTTDDSYYLNKAINALPDRTTLKLEGRGLLLRDVVIVNKSINLDFDVDVALIDNGGFKFDGTRDCRYRIRTIKGAGIESHNIALDLCNCKFCQFDVDIIDSCLYGISINTDNKKYSTASLGKNIFRFVRIISCKKGIVFWVINSLIFVASLAMSELLTYTKSYQVLKG